MIIILVFRLISYVFLIFNIEKFENRPSFIIVLSLFFIRHIEENELSQVVELKGIIIVVANLIFFFFFF